MQTDKVEEPWFSFKSALEPLVISITAKTHEEIISQIMLKIRHPGWELCQERTALLPSLFSAAEVLGSLTILKKKLKKASVKSDDGLSRSRIRKLPLNAFLHQPWNIYVLSRVFMWTRVCPRWGGGWGEQKNPTRSANAALSCAMMLQAYRSPEGNANDPSRHAKQLRTCFWLAACFYLLSWIDSKKKIEDSMVQNTLLQDI